MTFDVAVTWRWRRGSTLIRMPGGISFVVPWHYRTARRKFARAVHGSRLIEIPGQKCQTVVNAKQICYIAELWSSP